MSKSIDFGSEITGKIKESIKAKLADLGSYIDEELPDYIMIMIANRKSKAQMVEDLQLFLGTNTDSFVTWLQDMLQQLEALSSSTAAAATASNKTPLHSTSSSRKLEKQTSVEVKQEKRRLSENLAPKTTTTRSESDESGQSRNLDASFRQELDVKGGEDDNLGVEKSEETSTSHQRPHQKRRESSPVFDEGEASPTKQPAVSLRRRAVEQVPASRKSDSYRRRSRSKTPPPPTRRSRDSRSRSRSPRGGGHYSKRVVASILASRRGDDGRSFNRPGVSSGGRRSGHDRRSRDTPSTDTDHENESSTAVVSSTVRVAQRKPAVSATLQPTTSLLMRAIAEAKSSIEGVPQSEIKVPPNSSLAARAEQDKDKDKERAKDKKESDTEEEREAAVKPRRRGGVAARITERAGDRAIKSLHVLSTSDGGFLSRAKQEEMKRKREEERKKLIMSKLLLRQIEQEEQQLAEAEGEDEKEKEEEEEEEKEPKEEPESENKSEKSPEKPVEEEDRKKKEDKEAIREFNKSAVKDKSTKTIKLDQAVFDSTATTEASSNDVLVKALFRTASDTSEQVSIPLVPNKNNPQFIVTLEGVDESVFFGSQLMPKPKLPLSQRLEPRPAQSIQSRLGPPISATSTVVESSMEPEFESEIGMSASGRDDSEMQADFASENVNNSNQVQSDIEMKAGPAANRPAERCRFWPNCKAGDACAFVHPSQPCKAFPNCRFGARCLYVHPNCKFDAACLNPDCPFTHHGNAPAAQPAAPLVSQQQPTAMAVTMPAMTAPVAVPLTTTVASSVPLCKFFPNCTNPFCLFSHPKPCRFGSSCYYKATCTFWHPSNTAAGPGAAAATATSKLRWTAPSLTQQPSTTGTTAPPNTESNNNDNSNKAAEPSAATAVN